MADAAGVLNNRSPPRDRHGEQQGVEAGVVEPLSEVSTGCEDEPGLIICQLCELSHSGTSGLRLDPAVENDEVGYLVSDGLGDSVDMLAAFGEDDEGPIRTNELANVGGDQAKPVVVICECAIDLLDRRLPGEDARVEVGVPADHPPPQSSAFASPGLADRVADRSALHRDDRLVPVTSVRRRRQARDVSGRDR